MNYFALRMLTGDRAKYIAIICGITFTALLVTQQMSVFVGLMERSFNPILDLRGAGDLWIMDPRVQYVDDFKAMSDSYLLRVRGVPGIAEAVPLFRATGVARLDGGKQQQVSIIGLDDGTLAGAPETILEGRLADLRRPDAVIMDDVGARDKFDGIRPGALLELNDRRAEVVGICTSRRTYTAFPVIYTTYSRARDYRPAERNMLSFIIARTAPGADPKAVCAEVKRRTGLDCMTADDFSWRSMIYVMKNTGIPVIFGCTVLLGFVVGTAIAGQTLYTFTLENTKQFGALKAMGATNATIVRMVLVQTLVVAGIGFGLGVGGASAFGWLVKGTLIPFTLLPHTLVLTAVAVAVTASGASLLSLSRLLKLDPAIVFRG